MKTFFLTLLLVATLHGADDVLVGFDPLAKGNVRVEGKSIAGGTTGSQLSKIKTILVEVSPIGAPAGPVEVEFCSLKQFPQKTEPSLVKKVAIELMAGSGKCSFTDAVDSAGELIGWAVRVVKEGRIIGVSGSSPKFVAMASDPTVKMRTRNPAKKLATN